MMFFSGAMFGIWLGFAFTGAVSEQDRGAAAQAREIVLLIYIAVQIVCALRGVA